MALEFKIECDTETKIKALEYAMASGFYFFDGYELYLKPTYNSAQYKIAAQTLKDANPVDADDICHEQVQIALLKQGHKIQVHDHRDDALVGSISLGNLYLHWNKIPLFRLMAIHDETDDVLDTDIIIQVIAFGEVVYG